MGFDSSVLYDVHYFVANFIKLSYNFANGALLITVSLHHNHLTQNREPSLKGKAQYSLPPCTNKFRSAPFYT
jgi:hypothetical protein